MTSHAEKIVNPFTALDPERSSFRQTFYTEDQGSRLMPTAWFRALRQPDGRPFIADRLARFGYLPSPFSADLPIGFTESKLSADEPASYVGMTCSACHTRRITVGAEAYIIEGGPAFASLQTFMAELDAAVADALKPSNFDAFAVSVLGPNPTAPSKATLRAKLAAWQARNHELMTRALPAGIDWGPGRADAIQMIFNRVTGLDIGPGADKMLPDNILPAVAPTRYPFLWNADEGSRTQWMAFAPNGNLIAAYMRNLGQCLGVFARFWPERRQSGAVDYSNNSIQPSGLFRLEVHMMMLQRPEWPLERTFEQKLAELRGKVLWEANCTSCHDSSLTGGKPFDVGTDTRQLDLLDRKAGSGVLKGQSIPGLTAPLGTTDTAMNILNVAVVRTAFTPDLRIETTSQFSELLPAPLSNPAFVRQEIERLSTPPERGYEARKLRGIWAAAPYLHNGSVATLADLLKDPAERTATFAVGPAYDTEAVGLAKVQPVGSWTMRTTGCDDLHSGNSRCGHDYGTRLRAPEKQDLLEFLKTY